MTTINAERHSMIRRAVMKRPDALADVTVHLWERLASELISIIGENGFQSLYARSVHITRNSHAWIVAGNPMQKSDARDARDARDTRETRFTGLRISLEGQHDNDEASEASILLITTLVDIITLLIGELLMNRILSSAWGNEMLDTAGKEHQ